MSIVKRLLGLVGFGLAAIFASVALLIAWSLANPPSHEAVAKLPGGPFSLAVLLRPIHPFLAEYDRVLELRSGGETLSSLPLAVDSGGYARAQLYALPSGAFFVLSHFDAVRVDLSVPSLVEAEPRRPDSGRYLGAFERKLTRRWRFAEPNIAPEIDLIARGG